jgi:hypothetical protein
LLFVICYHLCAWLFCGYNLWYIIIIIIIIVITITIITFSVSVCHNVLSELPYVVIIINYSAILLCDRLQIAFYHPYPPPKCYRVCGFFIFKKM